MTWIAGIPVPYGYSLVVSDVRASWEAKTKDCLQKVYPVSPFVVAGFSGCVELGFVMIDGLREYLNTWARRGRAARDCRAVEHGWCRWARWRFAQAPSRLRKHGCSILVAGVFPHLYDGDLLYCPRVITMSSPDFSPKVVALAEWDSIGSGRDENRYVERLRTARFNPEEESMWRLEAVMPGSMAPYYVSQVIDDYPVPTVSPHVHIAVVDENGITLRTNDTIYNLPGQPTVEFRMPPVATSWREFLRHSAAEGGPAEAAVC